MNKIKKNMSIVRISVPTELSRKWKNSAKEMGVSRNKYLLSILEPDSSGSDAVPQNSKEESFDRFWRDYPLKKSKQKSKMAFLRLTKKEIDDIFSVLEDHLEFWGGQERRFIPHASSWLNAKRWEDEIDNEEKFTSKEEMSWG